MKRVQINWPFYLLATLLFVLSDLSISLAVSGFFPPAEEYGAYLLEKENSSNKTGISFLSLSILDYKNFSMPQNDIVSIQSVSSQWRGAERSNYMFTFTGDSDPISHTIISNDNCDFSVNSFGFPYSSAVGSDYGFSLVKGSWKVITNPYTLYLSDSLAKKMSYSFDGSMIEISTTSSPQSKEKMYVQGIVASSSINAIKNLLGDDFVLLPAASAIQSLKSRVGNMKLIGLTKRDHYENIAYLHSFRQLVNKGTFSLSILDPTNLEPIQPLSKQINSFDQVALGKKGLCAIVGISLYLLTLAGHFSIMVWQIKKKNFAIHWKIKLLIVSILSFCFVVLVGGWASSVLCLPLISFNGSYETMGSLLSSCFISLLYPLFIESKVHDRAFESKTTLS